MKKFIVSFLFLFCFLSVFADISELIPSNSSGIYIINNIGLKYESLKKVESFKKFLLEPINYEITLNTSIDMLLSVNKINKNDFYKSFNNSGIAFFMQEQKSSKYNFGVIIAPSSNSKITLSVMKALSEMLKDSQIHYISSIKKSEGKDYIVLTYDESIYNSVPGCKKIKMNDSGSYLELKNNSFSARGEFSVKNNLLTADIQGKIIDDKNIAKSNIDISNSEFLGTFYSKINYSPEIFDGLTTFFSQIESFLLSNESFNNPILDYLIKLFIPYADFTSKNNTKYFINILSKTKSIEVNQDINFEKKALSEFTKFSTSLSINDIKNIMTNAKIKFKSSEQNSIFLDKPYNLNFWTGNDALYVSSLTKSAIDSEISKKEKLSSNPTFMILKEKLGTGNISMTFFNLSKIYNSFGIKGNYGALLNINYPGNKIIEIKLIIK